jgi:hypothetical protein
MREEAFGVVHYSICTNTTAEVSRGVLAQGTHEWGAKIGIDVLQTRSPTPPSPVNLDIDYHARVLSCRGFSRSRQRR